MRGREAIIKEKEKIIQAQAIARTKDDEIRLHHILRALDWTLGEDEFVKPPSRFTFDDIEKFQAAWRPERRVKQRRSLYPRSDGRRHNVDRRSL